MFDERLGIYNSFREGDGYHINMTHLRVSGFFQLLFRQILAILGMSSHESRCLRKPTAQAVSCMEAVMSRAGS